MHRPTRVYAITEDGTYSFTPEEWAEAAATEAGRMAADGSDVLRLPEAKRLARRPRGIEGHHVGDGRTGYFSYNPDHYVVQPGRWSAGQLAYHARVFARRLEGAGD